MISLTLGDTAGVLYVTLVSATGTVTASKTEPRGLALRDEWVCSLSCSSVVVWTVGGKWSVSSVES